MRVAVAIVGFRNVSDIVKCLAALERSTHDAFEVIICENGGPAAFDALTAALPTILAGGQPVRIVLAPGNLGYAGGVNLCLRESPDVDAWWVLNPDTEPHPDAMAAQLRRLEAGDCEAVGGTVELAGDMVQSHGGRWQKYLGRAVSLGHGSSAAIRPVPEDIERRQNYLNGASMMVSRAFLDRVGPMREDYFLYCEEVEWCLRAMALGARLGFAADAVVLHAQGTTTGNVKVMSQRTRPSIHLGERNRLLLTRDCFPALTPLVCMAALAVILIKYTRRGAWRQFGYALGGWWAGLRGERGIPSWMT